jgi:transcription-repair coupling factor (superfamily II helicase)
MTSLLSHLRELLVYKNLLGRLNSAGEIEPLALLRAARPVLLAALAADIQAPIFLVTDRYDRVATYLDEINTWNPETRRLVFSEPTPMFYEDAAWGSQTRKDRLETMLALAEYYLPGKRAADRGDGAFREAALGNFHPPGQSSG